MQLQYGNDLLKVVAFQSASKSEVFCSQQQTPIAKLFRLEIVAVKIDKG